MSHAAMTSGLEWNLKVTAKDMGHLLEKFTIEFETYWNSREFIPFDPNNPMPLRSAIARASNPSFLADMDEILAWSLDTTKVSGRIPELPFECPFELHATYGSIDILAGLGQANLKSAGQRGIGVLHFPAVKAYALLITFQKYVCGLSN